MRGIGGPSFNQPAMDDGRYQSKNFYTYSLTNDAAIGSGGQATLGFNVDGDSDFFWKYLTIVDTTQITPDVVTVTVLITNNTTGRNYMNQATAAAAISGNSGLPFILPMVTWFSSKSSISVQVQESGGNTYAINALQVNFIGIKAFLAKSG